MKVNIALATSALMTIGGLSYSLRSYTVAVQPDQMTPSEVYARCYAKLLRKPIPDDNTLLVGLRSLTMVDAENACSDLLDKAALGDDGNLVNLNDPEARLILESMQLLHNSWFTSQISLNTRAKIETKLLLDTEEPGLYWTRSLFKNGIPADDVLKYNKGLKSSRLRTNDGGITNFQARSFFNYPRRTLVINGVNTIVNSVSTVTDTDPLFRLGYMKDIKLNSRDGANYNFMDVPDNQLVEFGEFIGIKDQTPLIIPRVQVVSIRADPPLVKDADPVVNALNANLLNPMTGPNLNIDLHAHFGGGAIGSVVYGLKNSGLIENQVPRSYDIIDRRFASRIFQDFLCYQLPVLKPTDVAVIPGSTYPFQQSISCMQCHGTMDEAALVQRNYIWATTSLGPNNFTPTLAPAVGAEAFVRFQLPVIPNAKAFALGEPNGKLKFRTSSDQLVEAAVKNFSDIGNEFSKLDDFYLCAAKRYYKYFTGIDVPLGGDTTNPLAKIHYANVKSLGTELKSGGPGAKQNLRELIKNIFRTEAFQSRNYLTEGVGK